MFLGNIRFHKHHTVFVKEYKPCHTTDFVHFCYKVVKHDYRLALPLESVPIKQIFAIEFFTVRQWTFLVDAGELIMPVKE